MIVSQRKRVATIGNFFTSLAEPSPPDYIAASENGSVANHLSNSHPLAPSLEH